jgi:hypothetical protein
MKANLIGREPVIVQALATIVVWAATRYGLQISDEQALQIAGVSFVILAPFVRQLVTPTAKQVTIGPTRTTTLNSMGQLEEVYAPRGGVIAKTEGDQIPFEPERSQVAPPPADPAKPPVP